MRQVYAPDFQNECRICGTTPTVTVVPHPQPQTDLCGPHFFADREMVDWERWNDPQEATE